ncbi:hypothetical protein TWF594_009397 [Orbilia oligospora]|nr:hypothetical protein TWF706_008543 [Orbilia oligospora]KAF3132878.1 hypothetical protein TWF594_009397 [Orbilia oligospora]
MFSSTLRAIGSLLLFQLVSSVPTPQNTAPPVCDTANFDSFPTSLLNVNYIGNYKNLYWRAMTVGSSTLQVTGVQAHSGNNVAAWSFDSILSQGIPAMLADYQDSETESFDLCGFAYGCALPTGQGTIAIPSKCTLTVTGHFADGQTINKVFKYTPKGLREKMVKTPDGFFSEFKGLKKVTFETRGFLGIPATAVGLIDDVSYSVKLKP